MASTAKKKKATKAASKTKDPYQQYVVEPAKKLAALLNRLDKRTTSPS